MASGSLLPPRMENTLKVQDHLKVQGTGISPRPESRAADNATSRMYDVGSPPSSSSRPSSSSFHSADVAPGDAYNVLQSVVTMNRALEGQIDALRLRLDIEAKHHATENQKVIMQKNTEIEKKEEEIDCLHDSLVHRDERIHVLVKSGTEKDKIIQEKASELSELRKLVKQTEEYAGQLYKKVGRLREDKRHLESDTLYQEQNTEIQMLRKELKELKEKCLSMEKELDRAKNILTQQNLKIRQFENDKGLMARNFKEELDKASRAMRQEVERMREVMNQNYEEMRNLREQNKAMHDDVKDIKELIMNSKTPREEMEEEAHARQPAAGNINMSTFLMAPIQSHNPHSIGRGPNTQRRSFENLSQQKVPRPHPSPSSSPVPRANIRVPLNRVSRAASIRASQGGVAKSAGQSSVVSSTNSHGGLPPIAYAPKEGTRWQAAGNPPADKSKNQRLQVRTTASAKRGPTSRK